MLNNHLEKTNIFCPSHLFTGIILIYKQDQSNSFKEDKQMKELSRFKNSYKNHLLFLPPHCQLHQSTSGRGLSRARGIWNKISSLTALPTSRISITELQYLTITENLNLQSLPLCTFFPRIHHWIPSLFHLIEVGCFLKLLCSCWGFQMLNSTYQGK